MQSYIFAALQGHRKFNFHRITISLICPENDFVFALFDFREHERNLGIGDSCVGRHYGLFFRVNVFK